jgi:hypothetical protein
MHEAKSVLQCANCDGFFTPLGGRIANSGLADRQPVEKASRQHRVVQQAVATDQNNPPLLRKASRHSDNESTNYSGGFRCPFCRTRQHPLIRKQIPALAWVGFAVLALLGLIGIAIGIGLWIVASELNSSLDPAEYFGLSNKGNEETENKGQNKSKLKVILDQDGKVDLSKLDENLRREFDGQFEAERRAQMVRAGFVTFGSLLVMAGGLALVLFVRTRHHVCRDCGLRLD